MTKESWPHTQYLYSLSSNQVSFWEWKGVPSEYSTGTADITGIFQGTLDVWETPAKTVHPQTIFLCINLGHVVSSWGWGGKRAVLSHSCGFYWPSSQIVDETENRLFRNQ